MHSIKSYALAGLGWACILMTACRASNRDIMSKNIEIEPLESLPLSDDIFRYIPPERKNINQHIEYDYNIAFNYADTFLFIDTWYYSQAKLGVVSVYYPDIKTGKK